MKDCYVFILFIYLLYDTVMPARIFAMTGIRLMAGRMALFLFALADWQY
jgi:hypothetical protein